MNPLVIKLNGAIEETNFDDWKNDLVKQLKSVNTNLTSDSEFAEATRQVKQFKTAEKSLKAAKESALEQAAEINRLFDAIDTVSEETRQVRLTLERQIKQRKEEIKQEHIAAGVEKVKAFIQNQSADFQLIDHDQYIDEEIFTDAVKRRSSAKTMQTSIDKTCKDIFSAIESRVTVVTANAATLDNLPANHQALFQDRAGLLEKSEDQLNKIIDERVAKWEALQSETKADTKEVTPEDKSIGEKSSEDKSAIDVTTKEDQSEGKPRWQLSLSLQASELVAKSIQNEISAVWKTDSAVIDITLEQQG